MELEFKKSNKLLNISQIIINLYIIFQTVIFSHFDKANHAVLFLKIGLCELEGEKGSFLSLMGNFGNRPGVFATTSNPPQILTSLPIMLIFTIP